MADTTRKKRARTTQGKPAPKRSAKRTTAVLSKPAAQEAGQQVEDAKVTTVAQESQVEVKVEQTPAVEVPTASQAEPPDDQRDSPEAAAPASTKAVQGETPLNGQTLVELCMSYPSFRDRVISRLVKRLS
jgi:hypothetical protein